MSLPTGRLPGDPIMAEDINDIAAAVNAIPTGTVTPGTNANVLGSGAASLGQVLTSDGASGSAWANVQFVAFATGDRPSAGSVAPGTAVYDTTLSKPIWSDGSTWRDASGAAV